MAKLIRQTIRISQDNPSIKTDCASFSIQNRSAVAITIDENESLAASEGIVWPPISEDNKSIPYTQTISIRFAAGAGDKLAIIRKVIIQRDQTE